MIRACIALAIITATPCLTQSAGAFASGPIQDGLQLSISVSKTRQSAVTLRIENHSSSPRVLRVGDDTPYWSISAALRLPNGQIRALEDNTARILIGPIKPLQISVPRHGSYQVDIPLRNTHLKGDPNRQPVVLSKLAGSGDQLRITLHYSSSPQSGAVLSKGDLVSGWLKL